MSYEDKRGGPPGKLLTLFVEGVTIVAVIAVLTYLLAPIMVHFAPQIFGIFARG